MICVLAGMAKVELRGCANLVSETEVVRTPTSGLVCATGRRRPVYSSLSETINAQPLNDPALPSRLATDLSRTCVIGYRSENGLVQDRSFAGTSHVGVWETPRPRSTELAVPAQNSVRRLKWFATSKFLRS